MCIALVIVNKFKLDLSIFVKDDKANNDNISDT